MVCAELNACQAVLSAILLAWTGEQKISYTWINSCIVRLNKKEEYSYEKKWYLC